MSGSWLYDVKLAGEKKMVISLLTLSSCPVDGKQQMLNAQTHCISILFVTLMATSMSSPRMSLVLMIMMTARCPCCSNNHHITSALLRVPPPTERRHSGHYSCRGRGLSPPTLHQPQSLTRISNKHSSLIQPANERGFDFIIT